NGPNAAAAGLQRIPERGRIGANRTDNAEAGEDGATGGCSHKIPVSSSILGVRAAVGGLFRQPKQVFQFAAKHEVMVAEQLPRARLVEVGEEDFRLGRHGAPTSTRPATDAPSSRRCKISTAYSSRSPASISRWKTARGTLAR